MALNEGDVLICCCECGMSEVLKAKQVEWYLSKGFQVPKRCATCRANRKAMNSAPRPRIENR
jgi:hypothetical protein